MSLTTEERETIISWCDDDEGKMFIHTTQRPMVRKLLSHPLFEKQQEIIIEGELVGVAGLLPQRSLSIRKKFRVMTEEQRQVVVKRFASMNNKKNEGDG